MVEVQILKTFDVEIVRLEFPALDQEVYGRRLIYFDNGATSQKPKQVIDAIRLYYEKENANIHRGVHYLSQIATEKYEAARRIIQKALNAESEEEIIFTKGTTDGINLLAFSLGESIEKGDEIIISEMEHHSNIVPWQMLCERKGCILKVVPINDKGELVMEEYKKLLSSRTKIVSITHISNSLGTINPIQEIIQLAHDFGAQVVIDGAQSMQHLKVDVQALNCDYFVFSGHKVFGPTGIGVLYGKKSLLEKLPPYQGGGDMIEKVSFEKTSYNVLPFKFEAGTPNIEGAICLGEASLGRTIRNCPTISKFCIGCPRGTIEIVPSTPISTFSAGGITIGPSAPSIGLP
jgi:cysteine desulfurase/selenocysteine lyase